MKNLIPALLLMFIFSESVYAQKKNQYALEGSVKTVVYKEPVIKYGIASFYANKFNGRQTANGEIYSSAKYTAACNVLPLGTWIKVTNLRNNKTVIVKINDRMHPKNKRLVDLSKIAAQSLAFSARGLTRVKVEVLANFRP
jgi:peptidoglycan lytic transglycosylase